MAFFESPRFPDRIAAGASGGPVFSTQVVATIGGAEQRVAAWAYPLHRWDVSHGLNTQADFEALRAFFLTAQGRLHGWRYRDPADNAATHAGAVERGVVLSITSTTFQLVKRYLSGAQQLDRVILKPLAAGFELRDAGTLLTSPADYTLNTTNGLITTTAPRTASALTWQGPFDVPMRFDTDSLEGRMVARNPRGLVHEWAAIPVVELRNP